MMKKFKPLQDQILSIVGQGIQKFGFDSRPKGQSFVKLCPFGKAKFHLAFILHPDDFDLTADVAIRFDQVEDLVHRVEHHLTKSKVPDTCTIGCELGNLSIGRQKRWTVQNINDIPDVAEGIICEFEKTGLPYIERFSDVRRVLETIRGDDPDSWLLSPLDGERAKRAVAIAFLTQGEQAARDLAAIKERILRERKDFGLPSFLVFLSKIGLS